jgi:hypothetical protein
MSAGNKSARSNKRINSSVKGHAKLSDYSETSLNDKWIQQYAATGCNMLTERRQKFSKNSEEMA